MKIPLKVQLKATFMNMWFYFMIWMDYSLIRIGIILNKAMDDGIFIEPINVTNFILFFFIALWVLRQWEIIYDRQITIWENYNS